MDAMFEPGDLRKEPEQVVRSSQIVGLPRRWGNPVRIKEVPSQLLQERIIFMPSLINDDAAHFVVGLLLYLESKDADKGIELYIDCYGSLDGHLYEGLAIYDTIQAIKPEVSTVCVGSARGIAAAILAGGAKGKRFCLPHASIILHEPYSRASGPASDVDITARELLRQRSVFYDILSEHTGQSVERIKQDAARMNYMTPQQALNYGLVDEILQFTEHKAAR